MVLHLGLPDDGGDGPLFVDAEGRTVGAVVLASHEFLESPDSIQILQCMVLIHQQIEGQFEFVDELPVGCGMVDADPEDRDALFLEVGHAVPEVAGLVGATGRIVLGVEIQHDFLSEIVRKAMGLAILVQCFERRRGVSFIQMMHDEETNFCGWGSTLRASWT